MASSQKAAARTADTKSYSLKSITEVLVPSSRYDQLGGAPTLELRFTSGAASYGPRSAMVNQFKLKSSDELFLIVGVMVQLLRCAPRRPGKAHRAPAGVLNLRPHARCHAHVRPGMQASQSLRSSCTQCCVQARGAALRQRLVPSWPAARRPQRGPAGKTTTKCQSSPALTWARSRSGGPSTTRRCCPRWAALPQTCCCQVRAAAAAAGSSTACLAQARCVHAPGGRPAASVAPLVAPCTGQALHTRVLGRATWLTGLRHAVARASCMPDDPWVRFQQSPPARMADAATLAFPQTAAHRAPLNPP